MDSLCSLLLTFSVALVYIVTKVKPTQLSTVILNLGTLIDNPRQEEEDSRKEDDNEIGC
jgi:hypothetical protein